MRKKIDCENIQTGKKKAAALVSRSLIKWAYLDVKIAFTAWRETLKLFQQRAQRLNFVISRQQNNRKRQCIEGWQMETTYMNEQMRLHLLAKNFASKQLMLLAYSKFHKNTSARRDYRLSKLRHILKAWRDSVAYRKYMMAQNVAASHMRNHLNSKLLSSCFDQLRHHKEF